MTTRWIRAAALAAGIVTMTCAPALASANTIQEFSLPTTGSPEGMALGPDGNLWLCERVASKIGRITPSGTVTEFPTITSAAGPTDITAGPDGAMWFTEQNSGGNRIGRITTGGTVVESEFPLPNASSFPVGI